MKILLFLLFLIFSLHNATKAICTSPVYIINASNGKTLDLDTIITCTRSTKPSVFLNRKFNSWCLNSDGHILYNGQISICGLHLYGSVPDNLIGIFPQAMMNWNNLVWEVKKLGDGLNEIHSPSNNNFALSRKQAGLSLEAFKGLLRQKWIIIPIIN